MGALTGTWASPPPPLFNARPVAGAVPYRTPLHATHAAAGATFTEFAGYDMPVHYGSIKQEHRTVRERVGLFDVSHMSNLWVEGPGAAGAISAVTPKDASALPVGKGHYSVLLRQDGTILDDTFVFRLEEERFMVIPNAGMNQAAQEHIAAHASDETIVADETADWAILALQGPNARDVLKEASKDPGPKFHRITKMRIATDDCLVSGSGYTGEKGVELYVPAGAAKEVWDHFITVGAAHGIEPIGLGARDTLRLEKGFCLAGNEFVDGRTPLEANIAFCIDWDHEFLGKDALLKQKDAGHPLLWGLVQEKGIPRPGYAVRRGDDAIGKITSGTQSPTLGKGIALGYLDDAAEGDEVQVDVRGRMQPATVQKTPFV